MGEDRLRNRLRIREQYGDIDWVEVDYFFDVLQKIFYYGHRIYKNGCCFYGSHHDGPIPCSSKCKEVSNGSTPVC